MLTMINKTAQIVRDLVTLGVLDKGSVKVVEHQSGGIVIQTEKKQGGQNDFLVSIFKEAFPNQVHSISANDFLQIVVSKN